MRDERSRDAAIAMDKETFKMLGHQLVDQLATLLESIPARPVTRASTPFEIREALDLTGPLPEEGSDPATLIVSTARQLFDHSLFNAHPRFFGYITSSPAPIGMLGDFLASALNANLGAWTLAPIATEIEVQTVRWIADFIGFADMCGGLLVSGGNMANIVCLLAARVAQTPWDVRTDGVRGGLDRELLVYVSTETHTWIQKATDICGLGTKAIRWIPTRASLEMDVDALAHAIEEDVAAGHLPMMVVGNAGTIATGIVDPLPEIAAVCRQHGIWFHVDAAYGGFAAAVPEVPPALGGLREADSVAVDPHKWLYAPLEAGCALVRRPDALRHAFTFHPAYYHFDDAVVNFVDYGIQNSRAFRALKIWLAFRQVGARGYRQMIADDIACSRAMAAAIDRHAELELFTQSLSITTFRYLPEDLRGIRTDERVEQYLNDLNAEILDSLQQGGELFVSHIVIGGMYALRACVVNFHTTLKDAEGVPEIVARHGRVLDRRLRPAAIST
jgi:glutamate/tyrosine decarboxylase-like PLP-dependent enzyme